MYKIEWKKEIPLIIIMTLVTIAVLASYPYLPQVLPIHWGLNGDVDGTAQKSPLSAFFHLGIIWGLFFMLLYVPFIDPKREKYADFLDAYRVIRYTIVTMMCFMSVLVTAWALGYKIPVEKAVPAVVGLEFMFLGNMMGKIRTNWFVGVRFPWTMEDPDVWNKTNRLSGRLFVLSGLLTIVSVIFPPVITFITLFASLTAAVSVSFVYSFMLYKKGHK